jgi:hypothetical protein
VDPHVAALLRATFPALADARPQSRALRAEVAHAAPEAARLANSIRRSGALSPAGIVELVRQRRAADLARGRVVFVQGWLLARTEVELMALLSL